MSDTDALDALGGPITAEELAQYGAAPAGGSTGSRDDRLVSNGTRIPGDPAKGRRGYAPPGTNGTASAGEMKKEAYGWSDEQLYAFGDQLVNAGSLPQNYTRADVIAAWQNMVDTAADYNEAGKAYTPADMIGLYQGVNWLTGKPTAGANGGPKNSQSLSNSDSTAFNNGVSDSLSTAHNSALSTSSSVDRTQSTNTFNNTEHSVSNDRTTDTNKLHSLEVRLSDPMTARKLIKDALKETLGREPTKEESKKFQDALFAAEKANPTVTDRTSVTQGTSRTNRVTNSKGTTNSSGVSNSNGVSQTEQDSSSQGHSTNSGSSNTKGTTAGSNASNSDGNNDSSISNSASMQNTNSRDSSVSDSNSTNRSDTRSANNTVSNSNSVGNSNSVSNGDTVSNSNTYSSGTVQEGLDPGAYADFYADDKFKRERMYYDRAVKFANALFEGIRSPV